MSVLGPLLQRLLGRRKRADQAELALKIIERLVEGATNLAEAKARIARGAKQGDLDPVISWAYQRDQRVEEFIEGNDG